MGGVKRKRMEGFSNGVRMLIEPSNEKVIVRGSRSTRMPALYPANNALKKNDNSVFDILNA